MTTAVAASAEAEAPPPPAAPDVLSYLYGRILERNARETEPFSAVHESNRALRSTVDGLTAALEGERRERSRLSDRYSENLGGGGAPGGGGGKGPSRTEGRQREKIERLQDQLNTKLRSEVEASAGALKAANELAELKHAATAREAAIEALEKERAEAGRRMDGLRTELDEAQSRTDLAEKQYTGLKDSIRTLQERNEELEKVNSELIGRVVSEKEKVVDQVNKMNDIIERLKKEVEMLRALNKKQEEELKRGKGGWRRTKGGGLEIGGDGTDDSKENVDGEGQRMFGAMGVVLPTKPLHTLQAHMQEATAVRYDSTGTDLVATGSADSTVKIWDTNTGQQRAILRGASGHPMLGLDIGRGLVVGCGSDKTCRVWNLRTQRMIHQLVGHAHKITCARLFHNEKEIVTASADRSLKIWDISRNVYRHGATMRHSSTSNCLDVSSDAQTVVSGHMDGGMRFWDVRSGDRTADIPSVSEGGVTSVHFNPADNTKLLTNGRDSTLKLVDVRTCTTVQTISHPDFRTLTNHASCALSPDGNYAAAGSAGTGEVFVWRVADGKLEKKLGGHAAAVGGVAWGRGGTNGQQVASVDKKGVLVLWA